ncbi:hypothetical protein ACIHAR_38665 [Streptomyces sp. NPDC052016]|uniref:hypothetical protein n=1 Tax=Streptomyces sp. NPDC052016 TaxID=3365680 RepID=UPI0037D3CEF5
MAAVDAAHELVEGVGQAGFMLMAVVVVAVLGVGADVLQVWSLNGWWTWSRWIQGISVRWPSVRRIQIWRTSWGL